MNNKFNIVLEHLKSFLSKVGRIQAVLILGIIYFLIVVPLAVIVRPISDLLSLKRPITESYWQKRPSDSNSNQFARRQY